MSQPLDITLEFTPNPETLKYVVNRTLLVTGAEYFTSAEECRDQAPLGAKLFDLGGISAVMFGRNFITVTLTDTSALRELNRRIIDTVRAHLEAGETAVIPRDDADRAIADDATSAMIRELIDSEVRPAVAQDGGDIVFERFDQGKVYVHMKGACAGCPSSQMTLTAGIKTRLQALVPEVTDVIPIG